MGTNDSTFPSDEYDPNNNSVTNVAKGNCGDNIQSIIDNAGSFLSKINAQEVDDILRNSFSSSQMIFDGYKLPDIGIKATNAYLCLDIDLFHNHNETNGGF